MAKIINLADRRNQPPDNVLTLTPWEFRRLGWKTSSFIQMTKSASSTLEGMRKEHFIKGEKAICQLPSHFPLTGGMSYSIMGIYANRHHKTRMKEVYYLIGLMDCMINQVNPILRTDLIRAIYKKVFLMKRELNIHWYGSLDQLLLPIDPQFFNEEEYKYSLNNADTLEALYQAIRHGIDSMFEILSLEYVFYCPSVGD